MTLTWYLVVSALIFCIGAGGVLVRRNPLVILLCLELMLNAANLALVAFSRVHGNMDGQIFALIVMVIAACEVAIGLGLIVAMFRRRLPIDVDELRELQGVSLETYGWLVLLRPARRRDPDRTAPSRCCRAAAAGGSAAGHRAVVPVGDRRVHRAGGPRRGGAAGRRRRLGLRGLERVDAQVAILIDPLRC